MSDMNKPMDIPELGLKPPITSKVRLSDDMQQTLALLTGYFDSRRVLLKATESGVLQVVQPVIKDIVVFTATLGTQSWQGGDIPCTDVAVIGGLYNTGIVWVRPYSAASAANAWPLAKGDVFPFTIGNLNQLHITIETIDDLAAIAYTK